MRIAIVAAGAALAGCSVIGGGPTGPTALPKGADVGMWSVHPAAEVSQCLARAALADSYTVSDVSSDKTVYHALVTPVGRQNDAQMTSTAVEACL